MVPPRSPSPATMSCCSAMVATTGCGVPGSNSELLAPSSPTTERAYSMTMLCRPRHSPSVGTRFSRDQRSAPSLPSMPRTPKPPGTHTASTPSSSRRAPSGVWQQVGGHPAQPDPRVVGEPARAQRLGHRQVGVGQVGVLADQGDLDRAGRVVDAAEQLVPLGPVHVAERQPEPADDVGVQALGVQHLGDVVDARRVDGRDDRLDVDVARVGDLALDRVGHVPVGAADDGVGLDADAAQRRRPSAGSAWSSAPPTGR